MMHAPNLDLPVIKELFTLITRPSTHTNTVRHVFVVAAFAPAPVLPSVDALAAFVASAMMDIFLGTGTRLYLVIFSYRSEDPMKDSIDASQILPIMTVVAEVHEWRRGRQRVVVVLPKFIQKRPILISGVR
jgi:hypothetical protein